MVPQSGAADTYGLPGTAGDRFFQFVPGTGYRDWLFDDADLKWIPDPGLPSLEVGEAFFLFRANTAGTWTRSFSVNN